ncbi:hypothetical protein ACIGGF_21230 [Rhodococcus sp. NPDC078407]|uniref:hypothetical protein n=1 Tax=Rhodococcus sp. NPDC078407 TaxID=3364509 RepID=UPI0037CBD3AA
MSDANALIEGYRSYAAASELSSIDSSAPAITPATPPVLSFIAESSVACGAGVGVISSGAIGASVAWGC